MPSLPTKRLPAPRAPALLAAAAAALLAGCAPPRAAVTTPTPQAAQLPARFTGDDSARIATLRSGGVQVEGRRVVAWFPRDSVPEGRMRALVDSLDAAVAVLQDVVGGPHGWSRLGGGRVVYYFPAERFVAHAQYSTVFVPLFRVQNRTAPLLHETAHVLLEAPPPYYPWELPDSAAVERARTRLPLWLAEGIADHAAKEAAARVGFPEGDVQETGGPARVDSVCAARLRGPRGAEVAAFVGAPGVLPALFTGERREVSPTFYACSYSFTRFLAQRTGAPFLASLIPRIMHEGIEGHLRERTGHTLPELRARWLERIGAAAALGTGRAP